MNDTPFRNRARHWWRKELRPMLLLALALFAIRSSLADWNDVPTGSMRPTILEGDRVFVNKLAYDLKVPFTTWRLAEWGTPARGDIVVFYSPRNGERLVKRVIGLPGDKIELRNDALILNGQPVSYEALPDKAVRDLNPAEKATTVFATENLPGRSHAVAGLPAVSALRDFGPFQVPANQYFVMGDNRDNSFDSRYWGTVPREKIVGRATAVAMSFDRSHNWSPRWDRFFRGL